MSWRWMRWKSVREGEDWNKKHAHGLTPESSRWLLGMNGTKSGNFFLFSVWSCRTVECLWLIKNLCVEYEPIGWLYSHQLCRLSVDRGPCGLIFIHGHTIQWIESIQRQICISCIKVERPNESGLLSCLMAIKNYRRRENCLSPYRAILIENGLLCDSRIAWQP